MRKPVALKDHQRERRTFRFRSVLAFAVVVLMMFGLVSRLIYLQVVEHERYRSLSDQNRIQLQPVPPNRGLIYDTNGVLLADNRPSHNLSLVKERVPDLEATIAELSTLVQISERDIEGFQRRLNQRRRPFEAVPLRFRLSDEDIARVAVNFHRLPGVQIDAELIRYYPYGQSLVHALGYVGRINQRELGEVDQQNYSGTHHIGKLGVERFYEDQLHGRVGVQQVETNARGQVLQVVERDDPTPGRDLTLYLDLELQQTAEQLLGDRRGAVVALDPETGGILALVSTPGYDPNPFVTGISGRDYRGLQQHEDLPLFNRALRGRYPPASTIKPIIGLAAIDSGTVGLGHKVWDPGWYQITKEGRFYRDWKRQGHGMVNLRDAIAESCDVFFYDIGHRMGIDPMSDYLGRFGFGKITTLDLPEAHGALLPSRDWKKAVRGRSWYPGDSLNLSIGQGFMISTPMQLATATMVIANRGKWINPRMLKAMSGEDEQGNPFVLDVPDRKLMPDIELNRDSYWDYLRRSMVEVMHGKKGTARRSAKDSPYRIAGKTGTAQVVRIKQDEEYDAEKLAERHRDHGLFVGFAPANKPEIVVAVIVENGGGGSSAAAPVARELFDNYLLRESQLQSQEQLADNGGAS
ncbi:penicillin-binding protein 2 [Motiliproteus coralliicola]|uniref:Peptidoglycan D,D-transpeptidase MrdA n=1 Tax=Motiliproteus coralliicola TaxID=2283196 RepID=A0A369WSE0_9GAMM|nr:penicillin-binding protein 2 [Motiliproteus coralliicola]RDE24093.1 penicillin-binding protein 2 [Motiliproteus coralliicola]